MNPLLVTMRGPSDIQIEDLSNFEAGIAFLVMLDQLAPGITFGDLPKLAAGETLSGFNIFRATSNLVKGVGSGVADAAGTVAKGIGTVKDGVGDVLRDTFTTVGKGAGDAIRLVTDEKVVDGASRIGTAYATSGGSEGVRNLFGGSDTGESILQFISNLGSSFKGASSAPVSEASMFGGTKNLPWVIAGGAVLVLLFARPGASRR